MPAHGERRGRHRRYLEGMDLTPTEMTETNETAEQQSEVANTHGTHTTIMIMSTRISMLLR